MKIEDLSARLAPVRAIAFEEGRLRVRATIVFVTCRTPPPVANACAKPKRWSEGIVKTFSLRGIKDSPPYLHGGRLFTLEDTGEFFNLLLATKLTGDQKRHLVAYLRAL